MSDTADVGTPTVQKPAWLPDALYQMWLDAFINAGGSSVPGAETVAIEYVRNQPEYDTYFPGLRREDGSLRYAVNPEATYYNNIQAFRNTVRGMNLNPDIFSSEYIDLIKGDTSPSEFSDRANALYDRVIASSASIRDWYAQAIGIDMTDSAILASLMSSRIEDAVLNRQITMAEIGGEATQRNFDITDQFVELLAQNGMNRSEAQQLFGTAERLVPMLGALAARHGNPDDTFDITEYAGAAFLNDPTQVNRINLLQSQEASTFTGSAAIDVKRNDFGAVTGLRTQ